MAKNNIKVKTLKLKKERIKYTIVSCTQEVIDKIPDESWDNILELTKNVVKKKQPNGLLLLLPIIGWIPYFKASFTCFKLAQGYNGYSEQLRKNNKKLSTMYLFPRLVLGSAMQKGAINSNSKAAYAKLAMPVE